MDEENGVFRVCITLISGEDLGDLLVANGHASRCKCQGAGVGMIGVCSRVFLSFHIIVFNAFSGC